MKWHTQQLDPFVKMKSRPFSPSCKGVVLPNISACRQRRMIFTVLAAILLSAPVLQAQTKNPFTMTPKERAGYFAKIEAESYKNRQRMMDLLHIKLPKNLPPPAQDPNRPKNTFQKESSDGWTDSSGNTYTRSAWGTWNNYDEARANPYPKLPNFLKFAEKYFGTSGSEIGR